MDMYAYYLEPEIRNEIQFIYSLFEIVFLLGKIFIFKNFPFQNGVTIENRRNI